MRYLTLSLFLLACLSLTACAAVDAANDAVYDTFGVPTLEEVDEIGSRPDRVGGGIGAGEGGIISLAAVFMLHFWRNYTRKKALNGKPKPKAGK